MRKLLFAASLTLLCAGLTTPAWAPGGKNWAGAPADAGSPPPPAAVSFCRTDATTRNQCAALWNACESKAANKRICRGDWRDCCERKAVRRW
jgi:hypothetical protein